MIELIILIISLPAGDIKSEQCVTLWYNTNAYVKTIKNKEYYGRDFFNLVCNETETLDYAKAYKY